MSKDFQKENNTLKQSSNTISVDECLDVLTGLVKLNVDESILDNIFSCMTIKTAKPILFYEKIKEAFIIVAIAKSFGVGNELNDYLISIQQVNKNIK